MTKENLQIEAQFLRGQGYSVREIQKKLGVSKSTVSRWVGGVLLTHLQKMALAERNPNQQPVVKKRIREISDELNSLRRRERSPGGKSLKSTAELIVTEHEAIPLLLREIERLQGLLTKERKRNI